MPRMKQLLRKLHIGVGGGINDHHRLSSPEGTNNNNNMTSLSSASSSALSSPTTMPTTTVTAAVADRTVDEGGGGINGGDDKGVDFGLMEEEFQMQLAMAISASHSDVRKDPDSAQIDAAKQMSLGCETSVSDTVQFQSLRYWV